MVNSDYAKDRMRYLAFERASLDAEPKAWSEKDVVDFLLGRFWNFLIFTQIKVNHEFFQSRLLLLPTRDSCRSIDFGIGYCTVEKWLGVVLH